LASLAGLFCLWWVAAPGEPVAAGQPTPVELTVVGGADLNPNAAGRASPVVVRIFDLAAAPLFETAAFPSLFDNAAAVLKDSVVTQEEFVLRPGDIQAHNREIPPQVRLLGVVAAFRDLEHGLWRLSVPITAGRRNFLLIVLDRDTIRVETVDSGHP
jgi:type VI secretion system protein VasD